MRSARVFLVLALIAVAAVVWTAPLPAGCPAQLPMETYELNMTHRDIHLEPVAEYTPGIWVYVVSATHALCSWFIDAQQLLPDEPSIQAYSSSVLLKPFAQNLSNKTITCVIGEIKYNFEIGEVYACLNPSPTTTLGSAATFDVANHSSTHPSGSIPAPSGIAPQTTPTRWSTNTPSATPSVTPSGDDGDKSPNIPAIVGGAVGGAVGMLALICIIIFIICKCIRANGGGNGRTPANDGTGAGGGRAANGGNAQEVACDLEIPAMDSGEANGTVQESQFASEGVICSRSRDFIISRGKEDASVADTCPSTAGVFPPIPEIQKVFSSQQNLSQSATLSTHSPGYDHTCDGVSYLYMYSEVESTLPFSLPPSPHPPSSFSSHPPPSTQPPPCPFSIADVDTRNEACSENSEWEETALVANGVEDSTKENMITGWEMDQEFHQEEDTMEGGYTTTTRQTHLLRRVKGAHTKKKDRLVGATHSLFLMYTPPSKWQTFKGNAEAQTELVLGFTHSSTNTNTQGILCC